MARTLEPILRYDKAAVLRREHFLAQHPHPFLVHAIGSLQKLDPKRRDDVTTDRLILERPRQVLQQSILVVELAPRDPDQEIVTVGVAPGCDVIVDDASVSKRHACFEQVDGVWRVTDADSSAGTQVNGVAVAPKSPHVLASGDQVTLGYVELTFFTADTFYELAHGLFAALQSSTDESSVA